jgi:hypothetical protein
VSAGAAAIAAIASLATITLLMIQQRSLVRPHVAGGLLNDAANNLFATFTNAGPGLAYRLVYCVLADHEWRAGSVSDGGLSVGETSRRIDLRLVRSKDDPVYLVWACQDVRHNQYIWSHEWESRRISRRRWMKRDSHTLKDCFRIMYPNVQLPG